jgi:hypothetical protein
MPSTSIFSCFLSPLSHATFFYLSQYFHSFRSTLSSFLSPTFVSVTVDLPFDLTMPRLRGIQHPRFTRLSATHYLLKDPDYPLHMTLHVGQIADYLKFDEHVRDRNGMHDLQSMPLGFADFADIWNSGVNDGDSRRISKVFLADQSSDHFVEISTSPICISDFFITPEQVGLVSEGRTNENSALQNEIVQEFASIMMDKRRHQRRGFQDRRDKRLQAVTGGPAYQRDAALSRLSFKATRHHSTTPGSSSAVVPSSQPVVEPLDDELVPSPMDDQTSAQ